MEPVQATEGKEDEESVQQCAMEKQALQQQYEAEKSAMQQQFEEEKQSLLQQCETEKDTIKQQWEEEKSSLQQRCETEKKARRQEQLVMRANLQAIKAGSFSSFFLSLDQTAFATFAARQLASYNHTLTASSSSLLSAFASLSSQLHAYRQRVALLNDQLQSYVGNYRVMVRVRPVLPSDGDAPPAFSFADDYTLAIHSKAAQKEPRAFAFDRVFPPSAEQEAVFAEVQPAILSLFRGMNACVMAYGQTGAGKTFTMTSEAGREGVIPRCCALLFEELAFRREKPMRVKVSVATRGEAKVSVCELYNEVVRDLLNGAKEASVAAYGGNHLTEVGVERVGDAKKYAESRESLLQMLTESATLRATAATRMNIASSRSHMLVIVSLVDEQEATIGKLTMVDLAGSENLKQNAATGVQMKEAQNINLSLFELTNVLRDLNIPKKVVTYRNSKLTMMLKVRFPVLCEE